MGGEHAAGPLRLSRLHTVYHPRGNAVRNLCRCPRILQTGQPYSQLLTNRVTFEVGPFGEQGLINKEGGSVAFE